MLVLAAFALDALALDALALEAFTLEAFALAALAVLRDLRRRRARADVCARYRGERDEAAGNGKGRDEDEAKDAVHGSITDLSCPDRRPSEAVTASSVARFA
jgi:hypothetical protein